MVVDQDKNLRRSLSLVLRTAGYLVTPVDQACQALEYLRVGHFKLVILDDPVQLNNLTLLSTILCTYPNLSILVLAAGWTPEATSEFKQLGLHAYLEKPASPDELLQCVKEILSHQS